MNPKTDSTSPSMVGIRRQREIRQHHLELTEGVGAPDRIPIDRNEIVIGRSSDADIRIDSPRASRQHAILSRRGSDYILRDNESHNGVFLNGLKIHSAVLRDGDVVQVADTTFVYSEG